MNPKKCAFGVSAGQFLGFLVHEQEIEIGLKSQEVVRTMVPPHYEEGASAAHWKDQFCQEIYLQSIRKDRVVHGLGEY
jgi:hypothetical protein